MERRTFLRLGLGGAALAATQPMFRRDPATAQPAPGPFGHGIASGDPWPDRVVLWTRVTPSAEATPGSGLGAPTSVTWQVAEDPGFTHVVSSGEVTTDAAADHTVKVDAAGLQPSTTYHYRFRALGVDSPVGRTRTAPADDADVASLRFGVVSCSNWEGGYFSAYRHVADRDDLDYVLHLGDYVYEYGAGGYGPGSGFGRVHDPEHEMVSLEDYRRRHALYKTDPDLRRLHERYAFITTIDDHEVTDNSWAEGAVNHSAAEGDYHARRDSAFQAYFEWMPIRVTGTDGGEPRRVWRQFAFGGLADLFMLDERTYRSKQPEGVSGDMVVLGSEPRRPRPHDVGRRATPVPRRRAPRLRRHLEVARQRRDVRTARGRATSPTASRSCSPRSPSPWACHSCSTATSGTATAPSSGPSARCSARSAASWCSPVTSTRRGPPRCPTTPRRTSRESAGRRPRWSSSPPPSRPTRSPPPSKAPGFPTPQQLSSLLPAAIVTAAPWFKYLDPDRHGFGVLEVAATHVQYDWHHIADRTDPASTASFTTAYRTLAGTNRLDIAPQLGGRASAGAPTVTDAPAPAPTTGSAAGAPAGATAGRSAGLPATGPGADTTVVGAGAAAAALVLAALKRAAHPQEDPS